MYLPPVGVLFRRMDALRRVFCRSRNPPPPPPRIEPCSLSGSTRTRIPFLPVWWDHLGTALEYRSIPNTPDGHRQLIDWAHTTAARVAVEGSGTFGRPAAVAAMTAGLDIREVPPQLTARPSPPGPHPDQNRPGRRLGDRPGRSPRQHARPADVLGGTPRTCVCWSHTAVNW